MMTASNHDHPVLTYKDARGAHSFALDRDEITIGRQPGQGIVLGDTFVSRRHAVLRRVAAGFEIVDLHSSHGTYVNGMRVENAVLHSGDVVQFGSQGAMKMRFVTADQHSSRASELLTTLGQFSARGQHVSAGTPAQEMGHLNFLLNAARRLSAGSATTDILHALLQLSIQLTGVERGFVFLVDEAGGLEPGLGLSVSGAVLTEDATISHNAIQQAIQNSSKFTVSDTWADASAAPFESVMANSIRAIYCIPLRRGAAHQDGKQDAGQSRGQLLGVLYLDSQAGAGRLNTIDHELLDAISSEAALLLDNTLLAETEQKARKAAEELAIAARIHAGLMPVQLPGASYVALQARTVPCREIGGDFYDVIELPDCLGLVIADVSGKGVPASIVAATLQGIIHAQMLTGEKLDAIAALVNRFLCARSLEKYATMVLMKLHPNGRLEYINCGHIAPLHISAIGVQPLNEANLIVGLIPYATYTAAEIQLAVGDRILLATDGIVEAENEAEEQFGDERFLAAAHNECIEDLLDCLAGFQGRIPAQDDCTLVDARYLGTPA